MREQSCAVTGHRPNRFKFKYNVDYALCRKLKRRIEEQLTALYALGARRFHVGGAMGVDMWAGEILVELKRMPEYADITLVCARPFPDYDALWDAKSRKRQAVLEAGCDEVITVCAAKTPDAYKLRNYYIQKHFSSSF